MQERHRRASDSYARRLVDQPRPLSLELRKIGCDIVDTVCHVVQAGPFLREEFADGRICRERGQELDMALTNVQRHSLYTLLRCTRGSPYGFVWS